MAEQFIDVVHVRAASYKFGNAAPPERVRRDVLVEFGAIGGGVALPQIRPDPISGREKIIAARERGKLLPPI